MPPNIVHSVGSFKCNTIKENVFIEKQFLFDILISITTITP